MIAGVIRRGRRRAKTEGSSMRMLIQLADDRVAETLIVAGATLLITAFSMGYLF
jgi:hypothetical protein